MKLVNGCGCGIAKCKLGNDDDQITRCDLRLLADEEVQDCNCFLSFVRILNSKNGND